MADYDNSRYTYAQVLAGTGYYMQDDKLRYSAGVKTMQEKLNKVGYNCGTPDGKFGNGTNTAVRNFQKAKALTVDGKAGKNTLAALDKATSGGGGNVGDAATMRNNIVSEAAYWIGKIPYCINSVVTTQVLDRKNPPPYMDCADFSSSVYLTKLGINIGPNTSTQITRGVKVAVADMKPGDLILFDWNGNGSPNHVGICSAKDEMIDEHGSNSNPNSFVNGENVRRQPLTSYYKNHILAVRRIIQDDGSIVNK
ncbi:MAG: peptidoglycan-binding protein [Lachnospiraceae bacterium]|nr:peptidoglycan-binding protein [Lachnospiraceae bacterium]